MSMISPVRKASNNKRSLASIRAKLLKLSADWEDVDQFFLSQLEQLADAVAEVEKHLDQFVKDGGVV